MDYTKEQIVEDFEKIWKIGHVDHGQPKAPKKQEYKDACLQIRRIADNAIAKITNRKPFCAMENI